MIIKFDTYNESVRDLMKPKSEEDVLSDFLKLSKKKKLSSIWKLLFDMFGFKGDKFEKFLKEKFRKLNIKPMPYHVISLHDELEKLTEEELIKLAKELSYNKTNESVRDLLKPKSMDDIKRDIKEKKIKPDEQLLQAASGGSLELVKGAFKRGAKKDEYALVNASINGHTDIIEYLIDELGYDVHYMGEVPLRYAIASGRLDAVRVLLDRGADIHYHNENPLNTAISHRYDDIALYLVSRGADVDKLRRSLDSGGFEISKEETDNFIENHMNESVRDAMKPKPESQIRQELEKLPARKLMHTAIMNGVDIRDIFSKEEIAGMNRRMKKEYQEDIKELRTKIIELNDSYYKGDVKESMDDDNKGYEIELNFPGSMRVWARKELDNIYFEAGYELEPLGQTARVISDWEEPETLESCVACIKSWLNVHWFQVPKDKTNESVRDLMKPKSKEDIDSSLVNMTPNQKFDKIYREYGEDILDFLSVEDYTELLHSLTPDKKLDVGCRDALAWLVKEALDEGVTEHDLQNSIDVLDVENRDWESVSKIGKMLIKAGVDIDRGNLLMDQAASNGDAELLQMIFDKRTPGPVGERIFRIMKTYRVVSGKMVMISEGDPKILKMVRDYRRKVREMTYKISDGKIFPAVKVDESVRSYMKPKSDEDIKKSIEDKLKDMNVKQKLTFATKYGFLSIFKEFFPQLTEQQYIYSLFITSCKYGSTNIIKYMLDNNMLDNVDNKLLDEEWGMVTASEYGHIDIVKLLLDRGVRFTKHKTLSLQYAKREGHKEIVDLLSRYLYPFRYKNNER